MRALEISAGPEFGKTHWEAEMGVEEVRRALAELGAERFLVCEEDRVIIMERRDYSRVRHVNGEEWLEFCGKVRRFGWKIEEREHIPLLI